VEPRLGRLPLFNAQEGKDEREKDTRAADRGRKRKKKEGKTEPSISFFLTGIQQKRGKKKEKPGGPTANNRRRGYPPVPTRRKKEEEGVSAHPLGKKGKR